MVLKQQEATIFARLTLHQSQRDQSIPTLSVLVGAAITAQQLWTQWLASINRRTVMCTYESKSSLFLEWLSVMAQHHDLHSLVLERVSALANQPADHLVGWLANASEYQTRLFWQSLSAVSPEISLLRGLLRQVPPAQGAADQGMTAVADGLIEEGLSAMDSLSAIAQGFITLSQLLPQQSAPGILIYLPSGDDIAANTATLNTLTQLVEAIPALPMGLFLSSAHAQQWLHHLSESRAKAMLRSGLIEVAAPDLQSLRQWLGDRGVEDQTHLQTILHAAEQYGMTSELLETVLALTLPANQPQTAAADTVYRSQAESFLFQCLEARPSTAGQFQVNAHLDICFGNRAMEVDFLAVNAKIVIEIDGYYHFHSPDNYRRDRRKDVELQQQGFLILRFLAEDVVTNLENILKTIDQALALRQP